MTAKYVPQLRISITSACDKRCLYCRPGGESFTPTARELESEELLGLTRLLVRQGITDIKVTGGEPMLKQDIVATVAALKAMPGVKTVHLVTRHPRAGECAADFQRSGLDCLNFSLDSLDSRTWSRITGKPGHEQLMAAIERAARTGVPIKINTVVLRGINDHEIQAFVDFAGRIGASLKLLDLIVDIPRDLSIEEARTSRYFDLTEVFPLLEAQATSRDVDLEYQPGGLGHPMPRFQMRNGATVWVKTSRMGACYSDQCVRCPHHPCHDAIMALRLTADGKLQRCLVRDDNLIDLAAMVRDGVPSAEIDDALGAVLAEYRSARAYDEMELRALRRQKTQAAARPAGGLALPIP